MKPVLSSQPIHGALPFALLLAASTAFAQTTTVSTGTVTVTAGPTVALVKTGSGTLTLTPSEPVAADAKEATDAKEPSAGVKDGKATPAKPAAKKKETPQELARALKALQFDRSGQALLNATKPRSKETAPTAAETFNLEVIYGDWSEIGKTLATLPPKDAQAIYAKLLDALAGQSVSVGSVLKNPEPAPADEDPNERYQRLQNEREEHRKMPAPLLSEDLYGLIDACPGNLREENVPSLTKLVTIAIGDGGRATFVNRLKTGWKGLGGETPEGKKLAARLLSSLGWIRDAGPFLPLKAEEWEGADTLQLVFAMEYYTNTGIEDRDERRLLLAADIAARLMKSSRIGGYTRPQFRLALDRLVKLLPALEPEKAQALIREQLFDRTATLSDLIAIIGELGQNAAKGTDVQARNASLGTQNLILRALETKEGALPANTAVLVMNWLGEAEGCYRAGGVVATEMSQSDRMLMRRYGMWNNNPEKAPTLSTDQVLRTAPPAALVSRLNPGLAQRVQLTLVKLNILKPDATDLGLLRDYVKRYPGLEREVCQDVLSGWVSKLTKPAESEQLKWMRAYGYYIPPQLQNLGSGIPLTRLRQNQNIRNFKTLLGDLRAISPEPLDPALVVQSFMTLHSGAEVYRMEDIAAIFGPPEKMAHKELLSLLEGMRARLGQEWRDPKTQQQAATNRTEQEAKDEVSRGYRTALEIAKRGIRDEDGDWEAFITRGRLFYDASQFELARQVKLTEYVDLRNEAFASFKKATDLYAAKVPALPKGQWTVEPYQAWFFVMLGASDLAQLNANSARTDPGIGSIGEAMRALPGGAGAKHLELFAAMLGEVFPRVPANIRQVFLRSGLAVVGADNPDAAAVTKSLDYYKELLDEIRLRLSVDGPSRVGHGQPFGAVLTLETTRQLLRESGGFGKYVQNQSGRQDGSGVDRNLRDDLAKSIHGALDETFEVMSITFHDPAVKTIDLARDGWVETPLAYLVLRAKNAAVDRIPSVELDMDFVDKPGQVVLPVLSQVEAIDAKEASAPIRPVGDLSLDMTMDEREWKDGKLVVEVQARGHGVIPDIGRLLATARDGFDLETVDGNLSVSEFVSDGKQRQPQADRNWQLTYRRKPGATGDVVFPFPAILPGVKAATVEYKHYRDADLVKVDAAQATKGVKLEGAGGDLALRILFGILALAGLGGLAVYLKKRGGKKPRVESGLVAPTDPTPFGAVAFLRRLDAEAGGSLPPETRAALRAQIAGIEAKHFAPGTAPETDFVPILGKWLDVVRETKKNA